MAKLIVVAILLFASAAHANVIYTWTGDCAERCAGQAIATLEVNHEGAFTLDNFERIAYSDNERAWHWERFTDPDWFSGSIDDFYFGELGPNFYFRQFSDGSWYSFMEQDHFPSDYAGRGINGAWTLQAPAAVRLANPVVSVPEPSVLALLALGLGTVGIVGVGREGHTIMNRDLAIEKLRECQENGDPEAAHLDADGILCALLSALGYEDVVSEYKKVRKWYG